MAGHITSIQRKYIRKHTKEVELDPSEMVGELNIVPYLDIVVNLIMFLLATTEAVLLIAQIETDLPKIARGGKSKGDQQVETPLNLNVTVTAKGVIVSGSGGKLAQGCTSTEAGGAPTVPIKGTQYDWDGLTKCVARVKEKFQDEDSVTISADPQIMYEHVVTAMDAVRNQGDKELFPRVLISVGVR
jgi:biopolymer transport protein TolR